MPLNLITDPWIPVRTRTGQQRLIAPHEIADPDICFPDWLRADFNIANIELLVGLTMLADPPLDRADWKSRKREPSRLQQRLLPYAPAFFLDGDGPRFLQDLEEQTGKVSGPDMLFLDSAGDDAVEKNSDLMVKRERYPHLLPNVAAIALFTLQSWAPSGGSGHRTSLRGGGPLVTLVRPNCSDLWSLVWANTVYGVPQPMESLPWMRPTRTSSKGEVTVPPEGQRTGIEAFFGMPRRLRLVIEEGRVTRVIRERHGTNYTHWVHPLTPYYRTKPGEPLLPRHSPAGGFGYRDWMGIVEQSVVAGDVARRAEVLDLYEDRMDGDVEATVIVAGYELDNMKRVDFHLSIQPFLPVDDEGRLLLAGIVESASEAARGLAGNLKGAGFEGETLDAQKAEFFRRTETAFLAVLQSLRAGAYDGETWLGVLRREALSLFDRLAVASLPDRRIQEVESITKARSRLLGLFGSDKIRCDLLGLPPIEKPSGKGKANA